MRFTTKTLNQRTEDRGQRTVTRLPSSVFRLQGFTLVELVVAIGIMALVILFAGNVFKASIGSYRIAMAQAEIMQKFRAITDQLNNDFRGLRKDAPLFIWFQKGPNGADDPNRLDQIMFFADGDFQSTGQWANKTIVGNLARIYYGQSQNTYGLNAQYPILARRQHISSAATDLNSWPDPNIINFPTTFLWNLNDYYEHDLISLSQWQALVTRQANVDRIINTCFDNRSIVSLANANTLHLLMTEKVGNFSVQWSYLFTNAGQTFIYWWPSIDPDGNPVTPYSDFGTGMGSNAFGFYFNTAAPSPSFTNWFSYDKAVYLTGAVVEPVYPKALKFTFTLYDSRGVFKDGQTFTHIVYIGD
ncbi:MAG: prepilin-type N-terminal cleavage/methylation domain-containing protein [Planctomycetes bacterium]|nr:prepilin-type N-terminal cleavage/methylation domain-containing protein [Planctomycetota bacterium]